MTPKQEKLQKAIMTVAHEDYGKKLNLYALFRVRDKATSQDLVQATFKKTWAYLVKGGKIDIMRSFLYHVLKGLIVDEYRKRRPLSLDDLIEKGFEPRSEDGPGHLMDSLDGKRGVLLISYLPEKYQKVMRMRYVQELSLQEMSLITGQSKKTIAVQLHRGLEKLKILYSTIRGNISQPKS